MDSSLPEIVIQPDGTLLIPRGNHVDNQFFISLLKDLVEDQDALLSFFEVSEQSEVIFGTPGLCG